MPDCGMGGRVASRAACSIGKYPRTPRPGSASLDAMTRPHAPLHGIRILSLALNLPGPAALMRCRGMGATCTKLEPPSGDPMGHYNPSAYAQLHEGVKVLRADLKTPQGQEAVHRELARTDILLTSFRPSALEKLGLGWKPLH